MAASTISGSALDVGKSVKTENKYNHNEVLTASLRFENLGHLLFLHITSVERRPHQTPWAAFPIPGEGRWKCFSST
jgi:hypothetical protein